MSYARRKIPITKQHLRFLLLHLDARGVRSTCDHSLDGTETYLRCLGVWSDEVRDWLGDYGGFCDCEVLLNVGHYWGSGSQW